MKTIVQHRFNSENQPSLDTFLKEIISGPTHNRLHDVYNIPGLCIAAQLKKTKQARIKQVQSTILIVG